MRVMGHLFCKEWLSQLALLSLEKTRLQGDLASMLQDLKRAYKSNVDSLFNRACSNRTGGTSFTWKKCRFRLDRRKKLFMRRGVELWHSLLKKAGRYPSLKTFGVGQGPEQPGTWATWWKMALHVARILDQMSFEDAFEPKPFCDSINVWFEVMVWGQTHSW